MKRFFEQMALFDVWLEVWIIDSIQEAETLINIFKRFKAFVQSIYGNVQNKIIKFDSKFIGRVDNGFVATLVAELRRAPTNAYSVCMWKLCRTPIFSAMATAFANSKSYDVGASAFGSRMFTKWSRIMRICATALAISISTDCKYFVTLSVCHKISFQITADITYLKVCNLRARPRIWWAAAWSRDSSDASAPPQFLADA